MFGDILIKIFNQIWLGSWNVFFCPVAKCVGNANQTYFPLNRWAVINKPIYKKQLPLLIYRTYWCGIPHQEKKNAFHVFIMSYYQNKTIMILGFCIGVSIETILEYLGFWPLQTIEDWHFEL